MRAEWKRTLSDLHVKLTTQVISHSHTHTRTEKYLSPDWNKKKAAYVSGINLIDLPSCEHPRQVGSAWRQIGSLQDSCSAVTVPRLIAQRSAQEVSEIRLALTMKRALQTAAPAQIINLGATGVAGDDGDTFQSCCWQTTQASRERTVNPPSPLKGSGCSSTCRRFNLTGVGLIPQPADGALGGGGE